MQLLFDGEELSPCEATIDGKGSLVYERGRAMRDGYVERRGRRGDGNMRKMYPQLPEVELQTKKTMETMTK